MLAVPAECSNYTVVAHRKEHERKRELRGSWFGTSFLRPTTAKSDLKKITLDEISKQSRGGVFIAIRGATGGRTGLCFNEQTFNQQFRKLPDALSAGQRLRPSGQLASVTSSNRFPDVSQLHVYLFMPESTSVAHIREYLITILC